MVFGWRELENWSNENMNSTSVISSGTNGETSAHDLFLLSDEQILEIAAEPQDIEIADLPLDDAARAVLMEPNADASENARTAEVRDSRTSADGDANPDATVTTSHQSPITSHDSSAPPQWLADRMSDPQV